MVAVVRGVTFFTDDKGFVHPNQMPIACMALNDVYDAVGIKHATMTLSDNVYKAMTRDKLMALLQQAKEKI